MGGKGGCEGEKKNKGVEENEVFHNGGGMGGSFEARKNWIWLEYESVKRERGTRGLID